MEVAKKGNGEGAVQPCSCESVQQILPALEPCTSDDSGLSAHLEPNLTPSAGNDSQDTTTIAYCNCVEFDSGRSESDALLIICHAHPGCTAHQTQVENSHAPYYIGDPGQKPPQKPRPPNHGRISPEEPEDTCHGSEGHLPEEKADETCPGTTPSSGQSSECTSEGDNGKTETEKGTVDIGEPSSTNALKPTPTT